jgi:hypothetical protein
MPKVIELVSKYRAPPVAEKLAAAEATLAELECLIPQAALDEAEGASGAAARLAALNGKIAAAKAEVNKLQAAHRLAVEIDKRADVTARGKIRASQLAALQNHMRERDVAVAEICEAASEMAASYRRYAKSTLKMLGVKPIGTALPIMGMGPEALAGSAVGNLELLISAELFRCSADDEDGQRYVVPLGKPISRISNDPGAMPSAMEMFREAQTAMLSDIKAQVEKIDADDLATVIATGAAA